MAEDELRAKLQDIVDMDTLEEIYAAAWDKDPRNEVLEDMILARMMELKKAELDEEEKEEENRGDKDEEEEKARKEDNAGKVAEVLANHMETRGMKDQGMGKASGDVVGGKMRRNMMQARRQAKNQNRHQRKMKRAALFLQMRTRKRWTSS